MLNIKQIEFDERYDDEEYGTTTLYFVAPKELLSDKYPEAVSVEICVECPTAHIDACHAGVGFSPTKYVEEDDCYVDFDWFDLDLPNEEIEALIALTEK